MAVPFIPFMFSGWSNQIRKDNARQNREMINIGFGTKFGVKGASTIGNIKTIFANRNNIKTVPYGAVRPGKISFAGRRI